MNLQELKSVLDNEEKKDGVNVSEILYKLLSYWKWFIASVIFFVLAGGFYGLTQSPTYMVSSAIMIKGKEGNSPVKSQMDFLGDMDFLGAKDNVLDEMQVFNSRTLFRKMVIDLGLHTTYFQHTLLKKIELYKKSPVVVSMDYASLDTLSAGLFIRLSFDNGVVHVKGEAIKTRFVRYPFEKEITKFPATIKTPHGDIRFDRNPLYALPARDLEVQILNPQAAANIYKNFTTIALADKKANVISLSTPTSDVKMGQDIINKLIELYNEASVEEKNQIARNSVRFIDERLALITGELTTVEKNVENYKQANKLTNIEAESELFIKQTGDYEKQRIEVETQINLMNFVSQYIRKEENKYGIVPNIGITDEALVNILKNYNEMVFQRERLVRTTADRNPVLVDIERQIKSMRAAIFATTESSLNALIIKRNNMAKEDNVLSSRIKAVPRQEREFIEIKRQQEIKAALYTYLLQKREENSLTLAIAVPAARVIDEPLPEDKLVSKSTLFYVAVGFLLGLVFPVILIYGKSLFSIRIANKADLQKLTRVTLLGEIPEFKGKEMVVVKPGDGEPVAEMYRLLRTNLQFVMHEKGKKVLNITSTEPGEGKSTFAINMALTLAFTGKKVVMVGLDIRKPTLAEYVSTDHTHGVTSFLSGIETDINKLIHKTSLHENLSILPAGTVPPNPNELLLRDTLDKMFELLRANYDYIVVDTAPVGIVADTFLLDRVADLNLYIFRAGYSHKNSVKFLNDIVAANRLKNVYVVLKGCDVNINPYGFGKAKYGYYTKQ